MRTLATRQSAFLCNAISYNITNHILVISPAFLIGIEAERRRIPDKVLNWP